MWHICVHLYMNVLYRIMHGLVQLWLLMADEYQYPSNNTWWEGSGSKVSVFRCGDSEGVDC